MSVVIQGMYKPNNCVNCPLEIESESFLRACTIQRCIITGNIVPDTGRDVGCPLVELPGHHGRLIDADSCKTWLGEKDLYSYDYIIGIIDDEPTIIEAEGAEE